MSRIAKVLRIVDAISERTGKIFSFLVLAILFLEVREVIARYVFSEPSVWSWELSTLFYGIFFIMGGAWVLKDGRHVRTDVFFARFSPRLKALIDLVLFACLFFVFVAVVVWYGGQAAILSVHIRETTYTVWAPPLYPTKIALFLGFLLLGIQGLAKWIRDLILVAKGIEI